MTCRYYVRARERSQSRVYEREVFDALFFVASESPF
jgi:hypothetical protein